MLKMTIYSGTNEYEYKGNKEIGRILKTISESLLNFTEEYSKENDPVVHFWYGGKLNKIEIIEEQ